MIVYIAGPMTGLEDNNKPAFWEAEDVLGRLGYKCLNPASLPDGLDAEKYMPICLAMLDAADAVALLDGWERSKGAAIEEAYARYQGKRVVTVAWLLGREASEWY